MCINRVMFCFYTTCWYSTRYQYSRDYLLLSTLYLIQYQVPVPGTYCFCCLRAYCKSAYVPQKSILCSQAMRTVPIIGRQVDLRSFFNIHILCKRLPVLFGSFHEIQQRCHHPIIVNDSDDNDE